MKSSQLLLFVLLLFVIASCSKEDPISNRGDNVLYFNSFETEEDFSAFEGNAFFPIEDTPDNAGAQALGVSGGCILPHLQFEVGPFDEDMEVMMHFMAKSGDFKCGGVQMRINDFEISPVGILVDDFNWKHYDSESLFVPANEVIRIEFLCGGIAACPAFFDLFTIEKL